MYTKKGEKRMNYIELQFIVECPFCYNEQYESGEFNILDGNNLGIYSNTHKTYCDECDKEFKYKAYCSFDISCDSFKEC